MYCDVLYSKFKNVDVEYGIECIIDREQVLLIKDKDLFKYKELNKSGTKYLNSAKAAKFKHVDKLIENQHRLFISDNKDFEELYDKTRKELK